MLERFDVGLVQIDRELRVVAMNDFARRVLPVEEKQPFDKVVLSFHPDRSKPKLKFLIDQTECPVANPPPMTMIINIPERVLLIKVTKLSGREGATVGYALVFYDITEAVSSDDMPHRPEAKRQLQKIPTIKQHRIVLVDISAVYYVRAEGHYTWVQTSQGSHFCNLAIGDLEERLDSKMFLRIHRSYLVNLNFADQIVREEGRVVVKLRDVGATGLPVARGNVAALMAHLGISDALPRP